MSQSVVEGRMPAPGRYLFGFCGLFLPVGAHLADMANKTHIFNDQWPPHAKFHGGQTLSISILLGACVVFFAWRKTSDRTGSVLATGAFSAIYWVSQGLAIAYPGTAFADPQFVGPDTYPLGIAVQLYIEVVVLALTVLAGWLALRRGAVWKA